MPPSSSQISQSFLRLVSIRFSVPNFETGLEKVPYLMQQSHVIISRGFSLRSCLTSETCYKGSLSLSGRVSNKMILVISLFPCAMYAHRVSNWKVSLSSLFLLTVCVCLSLSLARSLALSLSHVSFSFSFHLNLSSRSISFVHLTFALLNYFFFDSLNFVTLCLYGRLRI